MVEYHVKELITPKDIAYLKKHKIKRFKSRLGDCDVEVEFR